MKIRSNHRLLAMLIALVMVLQLLPTALLAHAADNDTLTHVFDATTDVAVVADKEVISAGTTYADGFFTVVGKVTQRTNGDATAVKSIELDKKSNGGISFTVTGTASVTVGASSTGGSNTSVIALIDAEGNQVGETVEVTGTAFTDVVFADLAPGTYQVVNPGSDRNTRVETITVVETLGESGGNEEEPEVPEEPATAWDFRLDEYTGQASYHGLTLTGNFAKHDSTYGVRMTGGTFEIPVSGPCTITLAVGYNWDIAFPDGTRFTHESSDPVVYNHTGEAGVVTVTVGSDYTSYIAKIELGELVVEEEPATYWDFRLDEYTGQASYHGLTLTGNFAKHDSTYGVRMTGGTFEIPVSGPCTITLAVGYNWDIAFPDGTRFTHESSDPVVYNHTGEAGVVTVTVGSDYTSYIASIQLQALEIPTVPELEPGKIYVWDFGAEVLEGEQYVNMLTVDEINSWFEGVEPGTTGKNLASFLCSDGYLAFNDGGYPTTHRLRSTNEALTRYDNKSLTDEHGNVYNGYIYSNKGSDINVYVSIWVNAGEKVTLVVGSNGGDSLINFVSPSGAVATGQFLANGAKAQLLTFYPTESGEYRIYSSTEKLVLARIYREASANVTLTGAVTAPAELTGYAIRFTNTLSGAQFLAPVENGGYSISLKDGYTYEMDLVDANGYVIISESLVTIASGATEAVMDVTIAQVDLVTVTGQLTGLDEAALARIELLFQADSLYIPQITLSGNTYTAVLEKGVSYQLVVGGINDYQLASDAVVVYEADTTADIVLELKPTYTITIAPEGATLAGLAGATFTFTNLNEDGYVYTFIGTENIALRDGVYAVKVTNAGAFVQLLTSNLKVNGAATTKTIRFTDDVTKWDFSNPDFTGENGNFQGLTWTDAVKNKTYLLAKSGTITIPVSGPCQIRVSACYQYSFYFVSQDEASVDQKTNSTNQIDTFVYSYDGEAGYVVINVLGQSYITMIEVVQPVAFRDTITVGAEGCDFTSIGAALEAVAAMERPNNERVTILIQPGNYEEMLVVNVPNVTLKNASENPSTGLTNAGVDIEENAVRITWYYGHGYTYYSMGTDCKFNADILMVNKENGYPSFENPGSGTTNGSYWNASVVILADGFQAYGIIFENSFNQYISEAAANDLIVAQGGAKEGQIPRAELGVFSTTVQQKAYVERAAALAIADNCQQIYFENCKFIGRQDTLYGGKGALVAFYDCAIYGSTDYIFGGMTAVFAKCDLVFNTSEDNNDVGYITAAQQASGRGYLMYNCTVTSTTPGVDTASAYTSKPGYFGRPWAAHTSEVIFYKTIIQAADPHWYALSPSMIRADGWLSTLSGESEISGEFGTYEYALGVDNSGNRVAWAQVFTEELCADGTPITIANFLGAWDPFEGKDMTVVVPTEKVDNAPKPDVEDPNPDQPTEPSEHHFNSLTDVTPGADKDTIPEGTTFAEDFFLVVGKVTQRFQESKGGVYAIEIAKNGTGGIQFVITGVGSITITVSSTGGSNTSAVALINVETGEVIMNNEGISEVSGTSATTLTWSNLKPGTYQIISPESSYNRGFRLMTIDVVQGTASSPDTGDSIRLVLALLLISGVALAVILPRKRRSF